MGQHLSTIKCATGFTFISYILYYNLRSVQKQNSELELELELYVPKKLKSRVLFRDSQYVELLRNTRYRLKFGLKIKLEDPCQRYRQCKPNYSGLSYKNVNNKTFERYCFNLDLHNNNNDIYKLLGSKRMNHINNVDPTLYVIISDANINRQREFISILLNYGFQISEQSMIFSRLQIYDDISDKIKSNIITFSQTDVLPELKYFIVKLLVDALKLQYDPLEI